jgi:hypothetical protein
MPLNSTVVRTLERKRPTESSCTSILAAAHSAAIGHVSRACSGRVTSPTINIHTTFPPFGAPSATNLAPAAVELCDRDKVDFLRVRKRNQVH